MSSGFKLRLAALVLAMVAMVGLVAWTAHNSLQRTADLSDKLNTVQLQSFQIADKFQHTILELNTVVLRYGAFHDASDWKRFEDEGQELDRWLDAQRPVLATDKERVILDRINNAYDGYVSAAREIHARNEAIPQAPTRLADFTDFERQGREILNMAFQLADAHRQSLGSILAESKKSLNFLRFLQLTSLAFLLGAVGGLAVLVYRELIAPLRIKLVESQALMERQEKLASLGMLAAGLAHEIRNPLTAIKAWLFIQKRHLQKDSAEAADSEVIAGEINRLERIVKDVLLFARPSDPRLVVVPAEEIMHQVHKLLSPQLASAGIELVCENSVSLSVRVDPEQIRQVLINLIQNGADSIESDDNGKVTLRVRAARQHLRAVERETVVLEVADNGKGISSEIEKRLFDPFFTTKESGTGLGLSIAARIVEKHGGALQYQTQVDRGTTFGIVLPREDAAPAAHVSRSAN